LPYPGGRRKEMLANNHLSEPIYLHPSLQGYKAGSQALSLIFSSQFAIKKNKS